MSQHTHKAYILESPNTPLKEVTLPTPTPAVDQVLVDVLVTRVFPAQRYAHVPAYPIVPGTGAIGRIASVGSPNTSDFQPGQLVFCDSVIRARDDPDGQRSALQSLIAPSEKATKILREKYRNGSWAEKMLIPIECVTPLDEELLIGELGYEIPDLIWLNNILTVMGGYERVGFKAGETVVVAPATGTFGSWAVKVALALGAGRVVVVGRNQEALGQLEKMDLVRVKAVVRSGDAEKDQAAIVKASTWANSNGADVYFDWTPRGALDALHFNPCLASVKEGGRVCLMGGIGNPIPLNYTEVVRKNWTIVGQFMYNRDTIGRGVRMLASGVLDVKGMRVEKFGWGEMEKAMEAVASGKVWSRIVVMTPTTL